MSVTGRVRLHRERAETPRERLSVVCECGQVITCDIEHYQKVACRGCHKIFWALQPTRHGGMKLFPWPGTAEMVREQDKRDGAVVEPNYVERRAKWISELKTDEQP